jgi:hypothetical protein
MSYNIDDQPEPPSIIHRKDFSGDFSLLDIGFHGYDKKDIYIGLVSKEGIDRITNAFYRSICVAHKVYQWNRESRYEFLEKCGRHELMERMRETTEESSRACFRWLSAIALMDAFAPWYEATFDARKDTGNLVHIRYFLNALRDPENYPITKETFKEFMWDDQPVDMKPILTVWEACEGRLSAFVDDLSIQQLFFDGKGNTQRRKDRLALILEKYGDQPAKRIWNELNNEQMTFVDEE